MADSEKKLQASSRQVYRVAALSLAMGMGLEEAAAHAHIEVEALARYVRDERFQKILAGYNEDIEGRVIERVARRRIRAVARLQASCDAAAKRVLYLMDMAESESVSYNAAKGILRQSGIDLDRLYLGDQGEDPEEEAKKRDPAFFTRHDEAVKELEENASGS